MRIDNKYIRNRRFRAKAWSRIRNQSHPFETMMPYSIHSASSDYWIRRWTFDEQVKSHFEWIEQQARAIDKGTHKTWKHASSGFRRQLNKERKAQERHAMAKIRNGDYEVEVPKFKRDADWLYF
jgi:hypothetical protein